MMHKPSKILISKLLFKFAIRRPPPPSFACTHNKPFSLIQPQLFRASLISYQTQWTRSYSNGSKSEFDPNKVVDEINLKFAEAREEIEMALESKETVYFNEEAECARAAVKQVIDKFEGLLAELPDSEKAALQRSMGLKMEQLKAELAQLNE